MNDEDRLSDEAEARIAADRRRCAAILAEREEGTWFRFTTAQIEDLASGYVPRDIVAQMRFALDTEDIDQRRAERPTEAERLEARKARKKKATAA